MNLHNYKLTFSWIGFLAFLIPMIPNIIWAVIPRQSDVLTMAQTSRPVLDGLEKLFQGIMILLLIFVVHKDGSLKVGKNVVLVLTLVCLCVYLISWIIYFFGTITPGLLLSMAIIPSLYFIFFALYQRNYYAMIFGIGFGVVHTIITYLNCICKK